MSPQAIFLHKGGSAISLQTEFSFIWKICLHSNCKSKKKKSTVITKGNKNMAYINFFKLKIMPRLPGSLSDHHSINVTGQ